MIRLLFILLALPCLAAAQCPNIVPAPRQCNLTEGRFYLGNAPAINSDQLKPVVPAVYDTLLGNEGYRIVVEEKKVKLYTNAAAGYYYGLQTLQSMVQADSAATPLKYYLPQGMVTDYPRYPYRGMHLDVCRHFFSKQVVKQYIDTLASLRINYFHWHLTDDQGWRIEIKQYPRLTQIGAWRTEADGTRYGGYYTQEDIKEIVAYAEARYITIIPEIEMPGHSSAAVAAYPWLSCAQPNISVPTRWGIFKDIYCPTDSTFTFLRNVLNEVCALFPGRYVHIGGDEVPKQQWKQSPFVAALMKEKGLSNYEQVQHYFMQTMEEYLNTKGKTCLGWGEVTRGGLSKSMVVVSWRGRFAGMRAAKHGNPVVMAPRFSCYFDYPQYPNQRKAAWWMTRLPLKKVYRFTPYTKALTPEYNKYITGAEATLWTEYIPTESQLWYQLMPRLEAFSEALWHGGGDWEGFKRRLGNAPKQ